MAQVTTGWRRVFSVPAVYRAAQRAIGGPRARAAFVGLVDARTGDRLLDIGCGTGDLAGLVGDVRFFGHDPSADYVEAARSRYPTAEFAVGGVGQVAVEAGAFDIATAKGVLHHLDDALAAELFREAYEALRPGGRLITMDPVFDPGQSRIARELAARDRGQNVRTLDGYRELAAAVFARVDVRIRHDLLRVPYSHALLVCTK